MTEAAPDQGRIAGLDVLRGAAVMSVFVFHATLELNRSLPEVDPTVPGWLGGITSHPLAHFVPGHLGHFGVQLFFVISGFCIHHATTRWERRRASGRSRWGAYLGRRFWRIVPLYLVVLSSLLLIEALSPERLPGVERPSLLSTGVVHATFLQTLIEGHVNRVNPSFWSLAVEVQWYLLYPLLYAAMARFGALRTLSIAMGVCLVWRALVPLLTAEVALVELPFRYGFEWLLGVFGAVVAADGSSWLHRKWSALSGRLVLASTVIGVAVLLPSREPLLYAWVPPLVSLALVGHVVLGQSAWRGPRLARLGRVSYAFYLVHQPMLSAAASGLIALGVAPDSAGPFFATSVLVFVLVYALATALERVATKLTRSRRAA